MIRAHLVQGGTRAPRPAAEWLNTDLLVLAMVVGRLGIAFPQLRMGQSTRLGPDACAALAGALEAAGETAFAAAFEARMPGEFPAEIRARRAGLLDILAAGAGAGGVEFVAD